LSDIAAAARGRIVSGDGGRAPSGHSIDTRTLRRGDVFYAIVGKVHDGHAFVDSAVLSGASALVVSDTSVADRLRGADVAVVVVGDTTRALQDVATTARRESGVAVAAVTGSAGKTTTKELAALLLSGDRPTHASAGNLNNHYGLPLALLAMPPGTRACVLEMGISTPGEMDRLVEIAEPDLGLVTVIGTAHVGNFRSADELAEEKMKLPRRSRRALLSVDDPAQWSRRATVAPPVTAWGEGEEAAAGVRLVSLERRQPAGWTLLVEHAGVRFAVPCPLPGRHQARNLLAASALALGMGVAPGTLARQAALARPSAHRGEVLHVAGVTVLDDCYNANPVAMRAALDLLAEVAGGARRVLVAGDMLELGDLTEAAHRELGRAAAASGVEVLLGVGEASAVTVEAARTAGVAATHVGDAAAAGDWLVAHLRAGDVVLVKGSRGVGLDRAIDRLVAHRGGGAAGRCA
jgi:UDP-N-acetylmuramoyl-tripeptide--D-alanyl-D-alanine ligase